MSDSSRPREWTVYTDESGWWEVREIPIGPRVPNEPETKVIEHSAYRDLQAQADALAVALESYKVTERDIAGEALTNWQKFRGEV